MYDKFTPRETFFFLSLLGTTPPKYVKAAESTLKQKTGGTDDDAAKALAESQDTPGAYYYNNFLKTTFIKIFDNFSDITVEVVFWGDLLQQKLRKEVSLSVWDRWHVSYPLNVHWTFT